jgi:hypothetical protein
MIWQWGGHTDVILGDVALEVGHDGGDVILHDAGESTSRRNS